MGSDKLDIGLADRRHADEIIRSRKEGGECCRERNLSASGQTSRRAKHTLFGNEVLEEPIGELFAELFGVRRILDVGVQRDNQRIDCPQRLKRDAKRFTCRDRVTDLIRRGGGGA